MWRHASCARTCCSFYLADALSDVASLPRSLGRLLDQGFIPREPTVRWRDLHQELGMLEVALHEGVGPDPDSQASCPGCFFACGFALAGDRRSRQLVGGRLLKIIYRSL